MGGELRECGCYDGPWSEDDHTFISIRCDDHADEPGEGVPMRRDSDGHALAVHQSGQLRARVSMATSIKSKRRR